MTTVRISTDNAGIASFVARGDAPRKVALLGTALGSALVVLAPAAAHSIRSISYTSTYTLTETGSRSGSLRTVTSRLAAS